MIDLLFAGWKAAQMWAKWTDRAPTIVEGSVEEVRELRQMTEALYEDNQRLIGLTQLQGKKIESLETKIIVIVFVSVIFNILAAWGICASYHNGGH